MKMDENYMTYDEYVSLPPDIRAKILLMDPWLNKAIIKIRKSKKISKNAAILILVNHYTRIANKYLGPEKSKSEFLNLSKYVTNPKITVASFVFLMNSLIDINRSRGFFTKD